MLVLAESDQTDSTRLRPSRARQKLGAGQLVIGCFLRYPDAALAELLALQAFDTIVFDGEHGTLTPALCEHMVRAAELHNVTPGVRVEANHAPSILRYLDTGVLLCHVPGVESAEEATRAVRAVKFGPAGSRGLAASRSSRFGLDVSYREYVEHANRETQVVLHIESKAGVDAAREIAAVDGVDVLLLGALDLSQDLGHPGETGHPDIVEATRHVADCARDAGKVLGAVVADADTARVAQSWGARYLITTIEAMIGATTRQLLSAARSEPAPRGR